ncbi:MAG: dicarboxylate/amino acid:cation symporter [Alphaproteobacteria bacterium]|nr:dicarboxylate/amino acid:cation symporter [Alphaproteobacteria bacterium]
MAIGEDPVSRSLITRVADVQTLLRERLWLQVLVGMALGIGLGLLLSPSSGWVSAQTSSVITSWLALPGQAFLASIKFVVVPLVLASVIRGIAAGENPEIVGGIGVRTLIFFILTTICAVLIGLLCAYLIVPGSLIDPTQIAAGTTPSSPAPAGTAAGTDISRGPPNLSEVPRQIVSLVPTNLLTSLVQGEMLHIVIGSAILGIAMLGLPSAQSKPVLDVLGGLQAVCMVIVKWVLRFAPLAVFGLMADVSSRVGLKAIAGMGAYVATVIAGLLILLGLYLLIVMILARRSPIVFLGQIREVLLLAFSTSSSAAVMPLTLQVAEEKLKVPSSVSRFVIPLGTTINMGGTALYQAVATIFLAQVFGIDIGPMGIMLIVVMAVGAAIGSPGTPGVGIVILASILETVGVPSSGIVLIVGVDRILDMCRTAVNVCGDLVASTVISANYEAVAEPSPV